MMNGRDYLRSLADGRAVYFEGRRIEDVVGDPILGPSAALVARTYDRWWSPSADARSPLAELPRSAEDLRARIPLFHEADIVALVTSQSIMTVVTAAARIGAEFPRYAERIRAWVERTQAADLRVTECITDAKGDRSLPPGKQDDPDAYVRVVERRPDGVVIRGAKLHITGAALGHELLVIPTKSMKPGEEAYAIACAVPVSSPGVRIVNTTFAPRAPDDRTYPISSRIHVPEGFVVFDDVFVPEERVFLDGETAHAGVFAHSLGLWERLGSLTEMVEQADELVGFAQLVAEANGLAAIPHVREKISDMILHATMLRAGLEAAIARCEIAADGTAFPNELFTNAAKYQAAANYHAMVRHLHDVAGGSILTAPSIADLENEVVGPKIRKYMATGKAADGEFRLRLFHAIRDLTADALGGWRMVTNVQAGGGLYAQRIVTRKHYDLAGAKRKALRAAGMEPAEKTS